jgi:hypothetical protein
MTLSRRPLILLIAAVPVGAAASSPCCGPISAAGARMVAFLDASGVDRLWLAGYRVEWDTGSPISRWTDTSQHTHCSAFAASASMRLGVYLLRPPEHTSTLLANAQMGWLRTPAAAARGWQPVPDVTAAQTRANRGDLVLAAFENPDPDRPGHIAIVRPSDIDAATLLARGPFVTQAGGHNWLSVPLAAGFANHKTAWRPGAGGDVRFFAHTIDWSKLH